MVAQLSSVDADPGMLRRQIQRLLLAIERFGIDGADDVLSTAAPILDARQRLAELVQDDPRIAALDTLGWSEAEALCLELARLCVQGQLQQLLAHADIPYPIYNFFASFDENGRGPWDRVPIYPEVVTEKAWKLLGTSVRFPIGVPASGLTQSSEWIEYFARRGFNILTYKTVRSDEHRPHPHPHWVFVQDVEPWHSPDDVTVVRGDLGTWPKSLASFSTANSFGVPSPHPDVWRPDVERTLKRLTDGQLLILSVMGTSGDVKGRALIDDFVKVALLAETTGVPAIELNLSCPNTVATTGPGMARPISYDPVTTREVVLAVAAGLKNTNTKLVIKLGYESPETLEAIIEDVGAHVAGVSGINTVQSTIFQSAKDLTPFVGTADDPDRDRDKAGVSGAAIQPLGLDFVRQIAQLRKAKGLDFSIIGMGGVMDQQDVASYRSVGADAVQTATGACLNPDLPSQVVDAELTLGGEPSSRGASVTNSTTSARRWERLFDLVASGGYSLLSGGRASGAR